MSRLPQNVEFSELISAGTLGLMEAFGKFKPDLNVKFDTYAESRIRGAMLDELRNMDWLPRSLRQRVRVLEEAIQRLEGASGTMPTEEQLAMEMGLDEKEVRKGSKLCRPNCACLSTLFRTRSPRTARTPESEPYSKTVEQEIL
jgi:RNA polymerase sigma factor for flagellar operon FliA